MDRQQAKTFCIEQFKNGLKADQIAKALAKAGFETRQGTPSKGFIYDMIKGEGLTKPNLSVSKDRLPKGEFTADMNRAQIKRECKQLYNNGVSAIDITKMIVDAGIKTMAGTSPTKSFVYSLLKLKKFKIKRAAPKRGVTYDLKKGVPYKKPAFELAESNLNVTQEVNFTSMLRFILKNTKMPAEKRIAMALLALE